MIIYSNSNKEITAQEASQNVELKIAIGQELDVMNSVVACNFKYYINQVNTKASKCFF